MSYTMRDWFRERTGARAVVRTPDRDETDEATIMDVSADYVTLRYSEAFPPYNVPFHAILFFQGAFEMTETRALIDKLVALSATQRDEDAAAAVVLAVELGGRAVLALERIAVALEAQLHPGGPMPELTANQWADKMSGE